MNCFVGIFDVYASLQKTMGRLLNSVYQGGLLVGLAPRSGGSFFLSMISNKSLSFGDVDAGCPSRFFHSPNVLVCFFRSDCPSVRPSSGVSARPLLKKDGRGRGLAG